jgi:aminoglycoside phosphotransferase (APT) family kinase protein
VTIEAKPPADIAIDAVLVRALLEEQHPDLAGLALVDIGEGWDNRLFRLGDSLAVRVPRRAVSAALIEREQRWLPLLSPRLPVPVPVPLRNGRRSARFPWSWSIVPWFEGETLLSAPPRDLEPVIAAVGSFVRALHQPAPADAPTNPHRGVPLAARDTRVQSCVRQVGSLVDAAAVLRLWNLAASAPRWNGPPMWIHGDLHPKNLLVSRGTLAAVLDFGDLAAGDPATDLSIAWMLSPSSRAPFGEFDSDTWLRARGWALALGLVYLATSAGDDAMAQLGRMVVAAALTDPPR